MQTEKDFILKEFYRIGELYPIKMTFLCEYPYSTPNVYAVYYNHQTKLPERVHLPGIQPYQTDISKVWNLIRKSAESRLCLVNLRIKEDGIAIAEDDMPAEIQSAECLK